MSNGFSKKQYEVYLGETTALIIEKNVTGILKESIPEYIDLVIVLGGDGTILRVSRALESYRTLILPINLGGLGFLTAFPREQLFNSLESVLTDDYSVCRRLMLKAEHYRGDTLLHQGAVLNDVVINKAALARIINLETRVDGKLITTYLSDGLIVSTPTGSTAYSMAAGGPIVCPQLDVIVLTPICPHTLTNRPIVLGSDQVIEIFLDSADCEVTLTLDGQTGYQLMYRDRVVISRLSQDLALIRNPDKTFFDVLSHKLKWGQR